MADPTARPILFKSDMVRAILNERKTQTRRIVKPPPGAGWRAETPNGVALRLGRITSPHPKKGKFGLFMRREIHPGSGKYQHDLVPCPYGAPGDLLWVRETFRSGRVDGLPGDAVYQADHPGLKSPPGSYGRPWKPSIHMPRWASRLTLEITGVRVERLQDISEADARAEGMQACRDDWSRHGDFDETLADRDLFEVLWEHINGPDSWTVNPWVWIVEFQPHQVNVDQFLEENSNG